MSNLEPPEPVRRLRDAFGDPKPPDISRKITACVACRKQKIKCHMTGSNPPCARCKKKGLPCTVNRSLQMLLENDVLWKQTIEDKIHRLEEAVGLEEKNTPYTDTSPQGRHNSEAGTSSANDGQGERNLINDASPATSDGTSRWKISIDLDSSAGALPGHVHLSTTASQQQADEDIISRGLITIENAQTYFDEYKSRLDHFVYRILGDPSTSTLGHIREVSPILTTVVCAIGALHLASPDFDLLYKEFVTLSGTLSFSKKNTVNDVRALCIAVLWLSDLAWSLVGLAVRIATELQLHKSFSKILQGDREHYLQTRLYFLVYACDHHFSVPYGRPPITRECEAVRNARQFLDCEHATEDDARLVSQVLRWSICSNVYDTFGADVDRPLSDAEVPHVRKFSIALDSLRAEWADRFGSNSHVGNYPRKGVGLQYHFAKLYLCSHALRGNASSQARYRSPDIARELDEIANTAVLSAVSILRAVVSDTEIQSYLNGLPTYFDIMIAFAVVFLLKVSAHFSTSVQLDSQEIQRLMSDLITVLREVVSVMHPYHPLVSIKNTIESLLQQCGLVPSVAASISTMSNQQGWQQGSQQGPLQGLTDADMLNQEFSLAGDEILYPSYMSEYDFLLGQDYGTFGDPLGLGSAMN